MVVKVAVMPASLSVYNLSKVYLGSNNQDPQVVLKGLELVIPAGTFVALVGLNGSGKTTLLRVIAGLEPATSGEVRINGERADLLRRPVGMVSQELALLPWRTVLENVELGLELQAVKGKERRERAMNMLRVFGLEDCGHRYPRELSGGMRQKVAIARALLPEPELLLMDEPFSALDCQVKSRLQHFLIDLWIQRRDTVLFVTHDVEEAIVLSDTVLVISQKPARVVDVIPVNLPHPRDRTGIPMTGLRRRVLASLMLTRPGEKPAGFVRSNAAGCRG
jgi:NitT/TauT family transport system ATP-binding protein